jgi:hypothetical protein
MKIIRHRVNTIEELSLIDNEYGIEIDLRSQNGEIILSHDPYSKESTLLTDWLKFYRHKTLVLNVKEEGLEQKVLELMNSFAIQEFFFLDQSFPFMMKTLISGESRVAMRLSDQESFDNILKILNLKFLQPSWVWVDSFSGDWSHLSDLETIKSLGFKACLASPELHGRSLDLELKVIREFVENYPFEAVCTKLPEKWLAI